MKALNYDESLGRRHIFAGFQNKSSGKPMREGLSPNITGSISDILYCISNGMRRSILNSLAEHQGLSFSELMDRCGLNPKYDTTGTFTYHLSELNRIGVLRKDESGYRRPK